MSGYSLLRRIREPELAAPRRVVSVEETRAAVLEHLRAIFTTRAGSALVGADYGILSVTDILHSCPDAIGDVLKSLHAAIRKYEPRLINPVVKHVPGSDGADVKIRFEINADMLDNGKRVPVKFKTSIDVTRNVSVE